MIQIRNSIFETNSSSSNVLVFPKDEYIHVPEKVYIDTDNYYDNDDNYKINGCSYGYYSADNKKEFLGYLKYCGVEQIYIDRVKIDMNDIEVIDEMPVIFSYVYEPIIEDRPMLNKFLFGTVYKLYHTYDGDYEDSDDNKLYEKYKKNKDHYTLISI